MIPREAEKELVTIARQFKAVALTGPRQSGKTTLVRYVFDKKPYVSLENPDNRSFALNDPRGFLQTYAKGAIFDEVQRAPDLFSYLQQILDEEKETGKYILTGSNNFLLQENISQSLAGRIAYLKLLPFSYDELKNYTAVSLRKLIFSGCYPPLYDQAIEPARWYANYVSTYIERDVRQLLNVGNHILFDRFLRLCAGRTGQMLNMNNLAIETGVDNKTISSWIGILESSYILFRLKPHFKNFNKRIVKTPKLYFYDTGLVCYLLGIKNEDQLQNHPLYGNIFENYIVAEIMKTKLHNALSMDLYYWRDNTGHETDLLIDGLSTLMPLEIKAGQTITDDFFKNIRFFQKISGVTKSLLVYSGDQQQQRSSDIHVLPWNKISGILKSYYSRI